MKPREAVARKIDLSIAACLLLLLHKILMAIPNARSALERDAPASGGQRLRLPARSGDDPATTRRAVLRWLVFVLSIVAVIAGIGEPDLSIGRLADADADAAARIR